MSSVFYNDWLFFISYGMLPLSQTAYLSMDFNWILDILPHFEGFASVMAVVFVIIHFYSRFSEKVDESVTSSAEKAEKIKNQVTESDKKRTEEYGSIKEEIHNLRFEFEARDIKSNRQIVEKIESINSDIQSIKKDMTYLKDRVEQNDKRLAEVMDHVAKLESQFERFSSFPEFKKDAENKLADTQRKIAELHKRLQEIEQRLLDKKA